MPYKNYIDLVDSIIRQTWKELDGYCFDDLNEANKAMEYLLQRTKQIIGDIKLEYDETLDV